MNDDVELIQKESRGSICSYEWTSKDQTVFYTVSLNFARGKKRTNSQIDAAWKGQNNGVYKKWQPKEVSDVGDRASWSDLGGGQLRVAANGYIFYVSYSARVIRGEKLDDTQEMIDKTSTLAKKVIERM
ncbi:hypothetical protein SAMN05444483_101648 [Salegentibacter echinorum]|uniref:Uncharacterized protein n=1 Tax=Salegentibacter echinorum TaxID=1073325 RepID=A0A1M5CSD6_SALEC|nr:hypothetical protein [Salegentibacter echinorum]SHF57639.1 hypothetical protein SAMN05444483_101648 [Salegentibacter echinorum]